MADPRSLIGLDFGGPTVEDQVVAREQLRETPQQIEESLKELIRLIEEDGTLTVPLTQEFLIKFLRPTKFYPESALKLLKNALHFRESHKAMVGGLMPEHEERAFLDTETVNVLVKRDALGRRVMAIFPGVRWNPDILTADQIFRMFYLIHQAAILEPRTQINGGVVIIDFQGLSMKHVRALGPSFALRLLSFCQDSMPVRLKAVHIIRQPFIFNLIWNIFKPFIKEKLRKRVFFHGSKLDSLYAMISPEDLPEDFGGTQPTINYTSADWYPVLRKSENYITEWNDCTISK